MRDLGAGRGAREWKMVCPGREGPLSDGEGVHATGDWESALKHRCEVDLLLIGVVLLVVVVVVVVVAVGAGLVCSWEVDMGVEVVRNGMVRVTVAEYPSSCNVIVSVTVVRNSTVVLETTVFLPEVGTYGPSDSTVVTGIPNTRLWWIEDA